jgi:hypothetical protein
MSAHTGPLTDGPGPPPLTGDRQHGEPFCYGVTAISWAIAHEAADQRRRVGGGIRCFISDLDLTPSKRASLAPCVVLGPVSTAKPLGSILSRSTIACTGLSMIPFSVGSARFSAFVALYVA